MENAGHGAARAIQEKTKLRDRPVLILVGPGNNGGDGLVVAHHLHVAGARVTSYLWKRKDGNDPNLDRVMADGIDIVRAEQDTNLETLAMLAAEATVIVDALLGIGVSRPLTGQIQAILECVRHHIISSSLVPPFQTLVPKTNHCRKACCVCGLPIWPGL